MRSDFSPIESIPPDLQNVAYNFTNIQYVNTQYAIFSQQFVIVHKKPWQNGNIIGNSVRRYAFTIYFPNQLIATSGLFHREIIIESTVIYRFCAANETEHSGRKSIFNLWIRSLHSLHKDPLTFRTFYIINDMSIIQCLIYHFNMFYSILCVILNIHKNSKKSVVRIDINVTLTFIESISNKISTFLSRYFFTPKDRRVSIPSVLYSLFPPMFAWGTDQIF